jgi:mRNA interferase MazF
MASRVNRAEIWLLERPRPDRRRPVLVLSRPSLITALRTVTVAAITSTRRGSPTEVDLDVEEGLKGPCCVNLCSVFTVAQADLRQFVGTVSLDKMQAVCRALSIATACD